MRLLVLVCLAVPRASAQTQAETNRTACADAASADVDLNVAYGDLRGAIADAGHRRALRDAQRAWTAFRDAELASMFYVPRGRTTASEYGQAYALLRCSEAQRLTEARTEVLRQLLGPGR